MRKYSKEYVARELSKWQRWDRIYSDPGKLDINDDDDFNTKVTKIYIREKAGTETVRVLREMGLVDTRFKSTNVSDIIREAGISDRDLAICGKELIDSNTRAADGRYN